jgi:hypothetical protein
VNKTFKEAVDAARKLRGDQTWHLHSGCLYSGGLHRLLDWLSAYDDILKRVKVDGSGVTMEYQDWQLLIEALGARAWEQISLADVSPQFLFCEVCIRYMSAGCAVTLRLTILSLITKILLSHRRGLNCEPLLQMRGL